ncbi:RNA-binding protein 26-like isoform X1 [Amphibalanus amphitrite]|uniref:RNA-binding protein 26-like isoform X1 n=1 Tax=Amphibalanus amphitrite TaxID=1232801 RepID=UPI001C92A9E1|nr:RNA-binding protein 26-like isoform X1 [Amphibalanus amphitrite]
MIVEKPEILKQWMTETMEPLCDAEPGKLAKYVLALIKKDMPPQQLRESMKNNLDIFLHDQAAPFVDRLFETLETKSYMPQASPDSTTQAAAGVSGTAAAPVPADSARRRVTEPEGTGRGRGDRRPSSRPRDRDERAERPERKRSWEERRRRSPPPRDRRTRRSRSPPRLRTKSRSPPRPKSKSPARSGKSAVTARSSRSRSPRSRSRSRSRSLSRSRSPRYNRSKSPIKFDRSPPAGSEAERVPEPGSAVSDLRQKLNASGASGKQRCRDYDEKGYCMRGDQCPYDHGLDPVILNDVSLPLPDALKYTQPPPASVVCAPPVTVPPHFNPLVQPPPRPAVVEPYNPDAPSLTVTAPAPVPVPGWLPLANYSRPPPPHVRPYYPAAPAPVTAARQLLSVQVQGPPAAAAPAGPVPVGPRPRHPYTAAERGWAGRDPNEPPRKRGHFDMSRLGGAPRPRFDPANCSLELKKVPAGLNQITHLNNHFVKFGKITNIQVSFGGDPEAALVTFSNPAEAKAAYKCTEAVLNNRFIKVFWHNKEREEAAGEAAGGAVAAAPRAPVRSRLGVVTAVSSPAAATPARVVQVSAGTAGQLTRTVTNPDVLRQQAEQQAAAKQQSIDAIKLSQEKLAATVTLQAKHMEKQKEMLKLAADLKKRKTELLEKQLAQQKALLAKLENKSLKPEERQKIVTTVKALQVAIDKTRAEALSAVERELPAARAKEVAEREVLDAEMDLYQKQQAGVDTSQLQRRVLELKQQLSSLSRGRGRGRPVTMRGRGRGRGSLSYVPGQQRTTTVDRRPTKLNISGYELDEKTALLAHLAQYGEIVDCQSDDATPSVVVQFRSRQEAEAAHNKGRQFGDRLLTVNWHTQPPSAPPAAAAPATGAAQTGAEEPTAAATAAAAAENKSPPGSVVEMDLLAEDEDVELDSLAAAPADDLLAGDEEEEEEEHEEERSWRR